MNWLKNLFGGGSDDATSDEESGDATPELPKAPHLAYDELQASVLFHDVETVDADRLDELLADAGVAYGDVNQEGRDRVDVVIGDRTLVVQSEHGAFPRERTDRRILPDGFPDDRSHIGIGWLDGPGDDAGDAWADSGHAREVTRLIRALLEDGGIAVVLHRADGLVVPSQRFLAMTEEIDDPESRPFLAWLDIAYDSDNDDLLRTYGMAAFGLPEVFVEFDSDDDEWRLEREQEALRFVASEMVWGAGLELDEDDASTEIDVPLGQMADDRRIDVDEGAECIEFTCERQERGLVLTSKDESGGWTAWSDIDEEDASVGPHAYRTMFRHALQKATSLMIAGRVEIDDIPEMEPIFCELAVDPASQTTVTMTNGLGRTSRPAGDEDADRYRFELAVQSPQDGEGILDILTNLAAAIELDEQPWTPGDTLAFEEPIDGLQHFLLHEFVEVPFPEGPSVELWQVVALTDEEYEAIEEDGADAWLADHDVNTAEYAKRWMSAAG